MRLESEHGLGVEFTSNISFWSTFPCGKYRNYLTEKIDIKITVRFYNSNSFVELI